jgi:valyl-tRNA synthetase
MRYSEEKLEQRRTYLNKIWNACRYVEGVLGEFSKPRTARSKKDLSVLDAAILDRFEHTIKKVTAKMESTNSAKPRAPSTISSTMISAPITSR